MKRIPLCLAFLLLGAPLRAVERVPAFDVDDSYATGPTMLVRAGIDGDIREIWAGMDGRRMRHVPLFLETSIFGAVRRGSEWVDLRTLTYTRKGTRPGLIRLQSTDGQVTIEASSRRNADLAPMFVRYSFPQPVDFRMTARMKYPELTREFHADDASGYWMYSTRWRGENAQVTTMAGPGLVLATLPAGRTLGSDKPGAWKEIDSTREVLLCIDATETRLDLAGPQSYAGWWRDKLGGIGDTEAEYLPNRVTLETDNPRLDRLFECSVDAVVSGQFASGDVIADEFFYRDSWLRDGSYSVIGLSLAGGHEAAERYFSFWDAQRDFSVGGEREAQQPAIGITAMWFYSRLAADAPAFLATVWPYTRFYADYYAGRIAREGMLNVAEEWICFIPSPASWPNAEVYSGLRAAAKIATALGHAPEAGRWARAADTLQAHFLARAYDAGKGRIIPMAGEKGQSFTDPDFPRAESRNGPLRDDRVDAGMLIIGRMEALGRGQGIIPVDDPRFASTQAQIRRDLENPDHSLFRFGPNPTSPHAPGGELDTWPIIMAWAAQDEWLLGRTDMAWTYLLSGILNKEGYDLEKGCYYLPENWDQRQFADKPLITWSHGDFLTSTFLLLLGVDLEPDGADLGLAPSLPPGMNHARLSHFSFRGWRLDFDLARGKAGIDVAVSAAGSPEAGGSLAIRTPAGRVIRLCAGEAAHFSADPAQYYAFFGRSRNAAERASILSAVLGEKPAKDPGAMTPAELEAFLCKAQADFRPTAR